MILGKNLQKSFGDIEVLKGVNIEVKKGEIIGYDGEEVIEAPFDQTFLIMPSKRLFVGKTAVRLAYPV